MGAGTGALEALHELLAQAHFVVVHALQAAQLALVQLLLGQHVALNSSQAVDLLLQSKPHTVNLFLQSEPHTHTVDLLLQSEPHTHTHTHCRSPAAVRTTHTHTVHLLLQLEPHTHIHTVDLLLQSEPHTHTLSISSCSQNHTHCQIHTQTVNLFDLQSGTAYRAH